MKTIINIASAPTPHWVGDGFNVQGMFGYGAGAELRSPFLMLDYAFPRAYSPNTGNRRGVGAHPHRGFETVTIVYDGEVEHKDSTGSGGVIAAGDVQWMTAGAGIIHEEFHSSKYSQTGGAFHMVQLWVNLPAADKMTPAKYQALLNTDIPKVALDDNAGSVRVIAGAYANAQGPATTFSPMNVLDVQLTAGASVNLAQPDGWTTLLMIQHGQVAMANNATASDAQLITYSHAGSDVHITALTDTRLLLLAGEPLNEPVVGYGPFVMNTQAQIRQAMDDYNTGKFGKIQTIEQS